MRGKPGTVTHGLRATYTAGCRCTPCTDANDDYQVNRYQRGQVPPRGQHGLSGYNNFGCRCATCTEAKSASNRARYQASRRA